MQNTRNAALRWSFLAVALRPFRTTCFTRNSLKVPRAATRAASR